MDAQIENWDDLRYFLAVARLHSLSAAARALSVNHSTVFRRIGALEQRLRARLFDRHPKGYELTAVGEEMLAIAERVEDDVLALDRRVLGRDQELSGRIRVTTVEEVAALLAPELAEFYARYPGIDLDVRSEQRVVSLSRREADVALRPGTRPDEPDVVGRLLCPGASGVYASRAYAERHGLPASAGRLAGHCFVSFSDDLRHISTRRWLEQQCPDAHISFRSNTMLGQLAAVRAGFGLAVLPCYVGDREPALVRAFVGDEQLQFGMWLLVHGDLRQTARVRAFIDFLEQAIDRHRDLFAGTAPGGAA